jgi:hypothetical protein
MTIKRTPTKDPREFAAYVRAMKKEGFTASKAVFERWWQRDITADLFRAGVAYGRRSKAK